MDWITAERKIISTILINMQITPSSRYGRRIVLTPPSKPRTGAYRGLESYYIQIGKNKFIWIPISMLQNLFLAAQANNGDYNNRIFNSIYPGVAGANGTPCYIHVIGVIFEVSGLAIRNSRTNYWIKNY